MVAMQSGSEGRDDWMSPAEAAELCRVSEPTMKAWMRDGLVAWREEGKGVRLVQRSSIEAALRRPSAPATSTQTM